MLSCGGFLFGFVLIWKIFFNFLKLGFGGVIFFRWLIFIYMWLFFFWILKDMFGKLVRFLGKSCGRGDFLI